MTINEEKLASIKNEDVNDTEENETYNEGFNEGYESGKEECSDGAYIDGKEEGFDEGKNEGNLIGFDLGVMIGINCLKGTKEFFNKLVEDGIGFLPMVTKMNRAIDKEIELLNETSFDEVK